METSFSLLLAALVGFGHAFEADHLLAVSNIVTQRSSIRTAIKDGVYWGLGHSSTVFLVGLLMIVGKTTILNGHFHYFEALVGVALIVLGGQRIRQALQPVSAQPSSSGQPGFQLAYSVGLIHGLAGSGTMVLLVMSNLSDPVESLAYLAIFGLGSIVGMLTAAGVLVLPFTQRLTNSFQGRKKLVLFSSVLCLGYGIWMVIRNLAQTAT